MNLLSDKVLEVKNLKKNYNDQTILDNITLSINAYDIYALVGINGSGKTTLLSILSGLIQVDEGIILMDKKVDNKYLTSISFQPVSLYPYLSGKDNIELLSLRPFKAFELLNRFNQSDKILNKKVKNLSFGQKQLLGIAISLSKDAQLYLLDEPTNGLDIDSYKELINIIKKMSEKGKSFIISTHRWDIIEDCCNRIGLLYNCTIQKEFNKSKWSNPIVKNKNCKSHRNISIRIHRRYFRL